MGTIVLIRPAQTFYERIKYAEHPAVVEYLDRVEEDIVEHLEVFKPSEDTPSQAAGLPGTPGDEDLFARYRVNDLVDNATCEAAPVVFEYSPTYYNLFGRIDYQARVGTLTTDFTMIKAGSLHRANGGYLVLQARDVLASPLSWETLKRTLRSREIRIENMGGAEQPPSILHATPTTDPVQRQDRGGGHTGNLPSPSVRRRRLPKIFQGHRRF